MPKSLLLKLLALSVFMILINTVSIPQADAQVCDAAQLAADPLACTGTSGTQDPPPTDPVVGTTDPNTCDAAQLAADPLACSGSGGSEDPPPTDPVDNTSDPAQCNAEQLAADPLGCSGGSGTDDTTDPGQCTAEQLAADPLACSGSSGTDDTTDPAQCTAEQLAADPLACSGGSGTDDTTEPGQCTAEQLAADPLACSGSSGSDDTTDPAQCTAEQLAADPLACSGGSGTDDTTDPGQCTAEQLAADPLACIGGSGTDGTTDPTQCTAEQLAADPLACIGGSGTDGTTDPTQCTAEQLAADPLACIGGSGTDGTTDPSQCTAEQLAADPLACSGGSGTDGNSFDPAHCDAEALAANPFACTPDLANISGLGSDDIGNLEPGSFTGFTGDHISNLDPNAIAGITGDQLGNLNSDAVGGFTPSQFQMLDPTTLSGFTRDNLSGLGTEVIHSLSADQLQNLNPEEVQNLSGNALAKLLTNLSDPSITPDDVTGLLPEGWQIDPATGAMIAPAGASLGFRAVHTDGNDDGTTLPELPDFSGSLSLGGGSGGNSVLTELDGALQTAGLNQYGFQQSPDGLLNIVDQGNQESLLASFIPDTANMVQAPGDFTPGLTQDERGAYVLITPSGYQIPLLPSTKDPDEIVSALPGSTVSIGTRGETSIRQSADDGTSLIIGIFDPMVGTSDQPPGLYRTGSGLDEEALMVYPDGTVQRLLPTIQSPDEFLTAAGGVEGVGDIEIKTDGTISLQYDGANLTLKPTFDVTEGDGSGGTTPSVIIEDDRFYFINSNGDKQEFLQVN